MKLEDNILNKWFNDQSYKNSCFSRAYHESMKTLQDWDGWFDRWHKAGCPENPPELFKYMRLEEFAKTYNLSTLIETGTYYGAAPYFNKGNFSKIYTIEYDEKLYNQSWELLKFYHNIKMIRGDSTAELPKILSNINEPCLFWLDANHRVTLSLELQTIEKYHIKNNIILIDDLRLFGNHITTISIKDVQKFALNNNYEFHFGHDCMILLHNFYKR
jgi:hypothetical protein